MHLLRYERTDVDFFKLILLLAFWFLLNCLEFGFNISCSLAILSLYFSARCHIKRPFFYLVFNLYIYFFSFFFARKRELGKTSRAFMTWMLVADWFNFWWRNRQTSCRTRKQWNENWLGYISKRANICSTMIVNDLFFKRLLRIFFFVY